MDDRRTRNASSEPAARDQVAPGAAALLPPLRALGRTGRGSAATPTERVPDRIEEFLRAGLIAHVACVEDGEPA